MKISSSKSLEVDCIPTVIYQSVNHIIQQSDWEFEKEREHQLDQYCGPIDMLLVNSSCVSLLNKFSSIIKKEKSIENNGKIIELIVNNFNSPSIFVYVLKRVWYYIMNELQLLIDFLTLGYENVTEQCSKFKSDQIIQLNNLFFKQHPNGKKYFSFVKVNKRIYKIPTIELMIISLIRESKMWMTSIDDDSIIVLSTHGIKDYSFPIISKWIANHLDNNKFYLDVDHRRTFEEGITIVKGKYFMNKIKMIASLTQLMQVENDLMRKVILDTKFVRIIICEQGNEVEQTMVEQVITKLMSMVEMFNLKSSTINEIISIAIVTENPIVFLDDISESIKSKDLSQICNLLDIPCKIKKHLNDIKCPPNVIDVTKYFILTYLNSTNFFDHKLILLNTYFKLKAILLLNEIEFTIDDHAIVTTKFGTQIPISIISIIIEFICDRFIEPQMESHFEYDLFKFDLITHFN